MAKRNVPIDYTSRDFESIRDDLVNYARRYYPNTFKDFSEASFGALMLDTVAYVGDIMSFYLDYQVNESFIDSAAEYENILRMAETMGYKYQGPASTTGIVSFYVLVPANTTALGPNPAYMPIIKRGTVISGGDNSYILTEDVRFDDPNNHVVAGRINETTGNPSSYAIKAQGQVVSGQYGVEEVTIGKFQKFKEVRITDPNVVEIISVFDSNGREYFEVEFLTQDVVYKSIPNTDSNTRDNAPSLLRPFVAARRFTTRKDFSGMTLQFGFGSEDEISKPGLADPSSVVLQRHAKDYVTDTSFDPTDILGTDKLGIGPANTTLTITYRKNNTSNANAAVNSVTNVVRPLFEFNDPEVTFTATARDTIATLECSNEQPIVGAVRDPSIEEVRMQAMNIFPTQNRAVTATDYEAIAYAMPSHLGAIKRCRVIRDKDSLKRNLNMFVISENSRGQLIRSNSALKDNLKIHLNRYRMINDTVDILDAKIVNIGIEFDIVANDDVNRFEVLDNAITALRNKYQDTTMFIGERFYLTDIYTELNKVRGVVDTVHVKLVSKTSGNYSNSSLNIEKFMSLDGRYLSVPDNVILEIKFPNADIKGSVR